jgi:hypothetical protein
MKKMLIPALAVCAILCVSQVSCEPDEPKFVKKFESVINDKMYCTENGKDCALVDGHHVFSYDEYLPPAQRQLLNNFYKAAAENNVRQFFETQNWQAVFPPSTLNSGIMSKIANANYATLVNACDSSIMFVYRRDGGKEPENLIFAFQRGDVKNAPCGGTQ